MCRPQVRREGADLDASTGGRMAKKVPGQQGESRAGGKVAASRAAHHMRSRCAPGGSRPSSPPSTDQPFRARQLGGPYVPVSSYRYLCTGNHCGPHSARGGPDVE